MPRLRFSAATPIVAIVVSPLLMLTVAPSTVLPSIGAGHARVVPGLMALGHYLFAAPDPSGTIIDSPPLAAAPPFGVFDTPPDGQQDVIGEVAVTGWALDDSRVSNVRIYRSPLAGEATTPDGLVFIGDAEFVRGARPDVAAAYPGYPRKDQAGWGYMLLSNHLPNGGNGIFTLYAIATDDSGVSTTLGEKIIWVNNASSVRPFGTIDTPAQGQTVSGVIRNWGWALTPHRESSIRDGESIQVLVDGVIVGHPIYGLHRADVAAAFPGNANTNAAVGYFDIDTRSLVNGVHTISWVVHDDRGHAAGIGSRYFTVENLASPEVLYETTPGAVLTLEADHDGINTTHYVWEINGVDVVTQPVSVLIGGSFRSTLTAPMSLGTHQIGVRACNEAEGKNSEILYIRIVVK